MIRKEKPKRKLRYLKEDDGVVKKKKRKVQRQKYQIPRIWLGELYE